MDMGDEGDIYSFLQVFLLQRNVLPWWDFSSGKWENVREWEHWKYEREDNIQWKHSDPEAVVNVSDMKMSRITSLLSLGITIMYERLMKWQLKQFTTSSFKFKFN